ncbi:MAG: EamA family transporter, partial [Bacteroidetes bacterium]|nr:EamA family transporter [Bacteroidota bacterium]
MKNIRNNPALPYITLIIGLLFMANAAVLVKLSDAPGIVTTFYRMFFGTVILILPFVIHRIKSKTKLSQKGIWYAIAAGSCFGFDMALWSTGVVASNATLPTLMANMAPIWVGFGSMLIFKEKHKPGFWLGLILAVSGLPIMFSQDIHGSGNVILGALLGLGAGFFYGAFYLFSQPGRKVMDTLSYLFVSTASSSVVLFMLVLVFDHRLVGYAQHTWLIFAVLGLGVQVIGWFMINYSQGFLPASIVAPTLLGQPII